MKFNTIDVAVVIAALFLAATTAQTRADDNAAVSWRMKQINQPSTDQLRREMQGHVFIYAGLKDKEVDRVMNTQFGRLNSMMFTSVVVTNERGEPNIVPATGQVEVLDDGCD